MNYELEKWIPRSAYAEQAGSCKFFIADSTESSVKGSRNFKWKKENVWNAVPSWLMKMWWKSKTRTVPGRRYRFRFARIASLNRCENKRARGLPENDFLRFLFEPRFYRLQSFLLLRDSELESKSAACIWGQWTKMRFCDDCGTYLRETKDGLWCPKCKKMISSKRVAAPRSVKTRESTAIHVIDKSPAEYVKVSQACPKCGNAEAYRWFSQVSGEHAGIRRERTVEHFRCANCSHSWTKTA